MFVAKHMGVFSWIVFKTLSRVVLLVVLFNRWHSLVLLSLIAKIRPLWGRERGGGDDSLSAGSFASLSHTAVMHISPLRGHYMLFCIIFFNY